MVTTIWISSLVVAALAVADQMRRPPSEWTAADRDRGYWVTMTALGGFLCLGIVAALVYVIGVLPRFGTAQATDAHFTRAPAPRPPARAAAPPAPQSLWARTPVAPSAAEVPGEAGPDRQQRRKLVIEIDDV